MMMGAKAPVVTFGENESQKVSLLSDNIGKAQKDALRGRKLLSGVC